MKHILVINAGSSSLKFKLFNAKDPDLIGVCQGLIGGIGTDRADIVIKDSNNVVLAEKQFTKDTTRQELLYYAMDYLVENIAGINLYAIGHRVVHGADLYMDATLVTDEVIANLKNIIPFAPLHIPHAVFAMEAMKERYPEVVQVACFDTAFHRTNPKVAQTYALPKEMIEKDKLYRYGMHGLSYQYIVEAMQDIDTDVANGKMIVCHLGACSSLAAIKEGKIVATTMGFTPLEGLPMGTRSGSIDPGLIIYLLHTKNYNANQLETLLYHSSGMLGLTGGKYSDFREIEEHAPEAWGVFVYNAVKYIGSLIPALKGLDGIVFTAGIGENSRKMRADILNELAYLGFEIDEEANKKSSTLITTKTSKIKAFVVPTQEELMIAKNAIRILK